MSFDMNNEVLASRWLSKNDVTVAGIPARIDSVTEERVGQDQERKFALHFKGNIKPLLLNKVNVRVLVALHGPRTDQWIGKPVLLVNDLSVNFNGQVGAVRVRPYVKEAPAAAPAAPAPAAPAADFSDMDDSIPF